MDEFFELNPEVDRGESMLIVSSQFDPSSALYFVNIEEVKVAIEEEFTGKGVLYDMSNEEHRITLGHHIMSQINNVRNNQ